MLLKLVLILKLNETNKVLKCRVSVRGGDIRCTVHSDFYMCLSFEVNVKQLCRHYHMHTPSCHDCVTSPDDKKHT